MNPYRKYILTTSLYFLLAFAGMGTAVFFFFQEDYFLFFISLIFAAVAFDNTFCSAHAQSCGIRAQGHYTLPVFLRRRGKK